MKNSTKILLGGATLLPLIFIVAFLVVVVIQIYLFVTQAPSSDTNPPPLFYVMWALSLIAGLLNLPLFVGYSVHLYKSNRLEKDKKILWALALFFVSLIAMPIYWYMYVWREPLVSVQENEHRS